MSIQIVAARAHQSQLQTAQAGEEYRRIQEAFQGVQPDYKEGTVNLVFVSGSYTDLEKKMAAACVLVNKTGQAIKELHGVLRLQFGTQDAEIASATLDLDEVFLGRLAPDAGLLIHLNIPVRGLWEDRVFGIRDVRGRFEDVRVTYADQQIGG